MALSGGKELVKLINRDNTLDIQSDGVTFARPLDTNTGKTQVLVSGVKGSGYKLRVTVEYQRLGLSTIFKGFKPRVRLTPFIDDEYTELLEAIRLTYGVKLDLNETSITTREDDDGFNYTVITNDSSLQFSESVEVQALYNPVEMSEVLNNTGSQYQYPTDNFRLPFARVYSGGWFVPEVREHLLEYVSGRSSDADLAWLAKTLSGDEWVWDGLMQHQYNLYSAFIPYNGPILEWADFHPVTGKTLLVPPEGTERVLVLSLNSYLCTGLAGSLTIFY